MEVKFCLSCGTALETRVISSAQRKACPGCSFVHWGDYSVGVGAVISRDGKFLLVRRAENPGKGLWTNPGGYIEQHEQIHETIKREVLEESGIEAVVTNIIALRDQPRNIHNIYIAFEMEYVGGEPTPDGVEVDEAGFFSIEEMETMPVAKFTSWLIDCAIHAESKGLHRDPKPMFPFEGDDLFRA
jgi:ADP-ribose pyrophosphatase YjhB (NUDIX family)